MTYYENNGNMQIGNGNIINDHSRSHPESEWKYLEALLKLSEKSIEDKQQQQFIHQLMSDAANQDQSKIRSTIKKYGMSFVVSTLSNLAGGELLNLLNTFI